MPLTSRSRRAFLAALSAVLLGWAGPAFAADDDDKAEFSRVSIPTFDDMELSGTFYPRTGGKDRDAVVMLLHDFDPVKGGGSHGEWDALAARLQKEGYSVLSFDFRGFGNSKSVPAGFWKFPHNQQLKGGRSSKPPETIDQKEFPASYYLVLLNDISAARAFLDRKNDQRELNTSNLILIGAGNGATLGALWAAGEWHRQKDTSPMVGLIPPAMPLSMDDPEGRDLAACFWLTISPKLANRPVSDALKSALVEVARDNKVPTVFLYGKKDESAFNLSKNYLDAIQTEKGKKVEFKHTGAKSIAGTALAGSKLLSERLGTADFIVSHLGKVLEDRGSREWRKRDEFNSRYFWTARGRPLLPAAKMFKAKVSNPIPLTLLKLAR